MDLTTYPCPACGATANLASDCPGCGRAPDPVAAEVIRLDGMIREMTLRRMALAARVRDALRAEAAAVPPPAGPPPAEQLPEPEPAGPETSLSAVQSLLFALGGLLLAVGAIVFTAVAWTTFGVTGRAAILAGYTAVALAAPLVARRRGLVATAETFAAVGLLLVILDGYAARTVNLFGVAELPPTRYAGIVCAVTAVVSAGYAAWTGLAGPRFAALLVAQPALPLLVADARPSSAGWALTVMVVAAGNLIPPWRSTGVLRVCGWLLHGAALAVTGVLAVDAVFDATDVPTAAAAGAVLVLAAAVLVGGSVLSGRRGHQTIAGALAVIAVALAVVRYVDAVSSRLTPVLVATVVAALAGVLAVTGPRLAEPMRLGVRIGGWVSLGSVGAAFATNVLIGASTTATAALPAWRADLTFDSVYYDWQLPAALVLLTAGATALLPGVGRSYPAAIGAALVAGALPASFPLAWWVPSTVDLTVAAALAVWAAYARVSWAAVVRGSAAAVLVAHAVLAGLARLELTAAVLGAVTVLAVAVAVPARRRSTVVGGVAVAVGMAAWPGAVAAWLAAIDVDPSVVARLTLLAAALLLGPLLAMRRWWPEYLGYAHPALYIAVTAVGLIAWVAEPSRPLGVYAGTSLFVLAAASLTAATPDRSLRLLGSVPSLAAVALTAIPAAAIVLLAPYAWLGAIWTGVPTGVGLSPVDTSPVDGTAAVTMALLAGAVTLGARGFGLRWRVAGGAGSFVAAVATAVTVAALDIGWPAVPVVTLLCGLAGALAAATVGTTDRRPAPVAAVGVGSLLLVGAGLAGTLPTKASTLTALAVTLAAAVAAAAFGRTAAAREMGSVGAVTAAVTLAAAAALATDALPRTAALWVVAASAMALAAGAARRSVAAEVSAHAGAVVGLALTFGSARYAAAVCTLWGVAVGLRALWPGESAASRRWFAAASAGCELLAWWLLLVAAEVALVEAYTLPAAAAALAVGWLALRGRPALRSWVAYGPALAAAFLPSLATVLTEPGVPLRRLLLGVGAVAVVFVGALRRRQAPVVVGGTVAALVALHELVLVWQKLPTWLPITVAGLVLIGLAITYERRRRDMARLRGALARMT